MFSGIISLVFSLPILFFRFSVLTMLSGIFLPILVLSTTHFLKFCDEKGAQRTVWVMEMSYLLLWMVATHVKTHQTAPLRSVHIIT